MDYSYGKLKAFSKAVFLKIGCPEGEAELAATTLVSADLRGVDSHGVARLSGYVRLWDAERINATPTIKIIHETPSTAVVDGDGGLGLVVGPKSMEIAMAKAEQAGTGWVSVRNSNHFGIAGQHAMMALEKDMIGISMTNASPLVAPTFAAERLLGTNPIAVAIPAGNEPAYVADFATTTAANGKLEILQRQNKKAPIGWIQDRDGNPSENPSELKDGGALLPLGGDRQHGSHKGYCLGSIVDIFCAVLSGANYGPGCRRSSVSYHWPAICPAQASAIFLALCASTHSAPKEEFKQHMNQWIKRFRQAKTVHGEKSVLIPGDPERIMASKRLQEGIPLLRAVEDDLKVLAKKFDLDF